MTDEIQNVVTPEVLDLIEGQKRVKGVSMKKLCRMRGQAFLDKQKGDTVVMFDRTYEVLPTGWRSSKKAR